jgi:hypothetical protein
MKNKFAFLSLVVVAATLFSFRMAQTNFSGTWKLNEGKSELGQFGARGAATKIVVDQKTDGAVSVTTTSTNFQGEEVVATDNLTDGKEVEGAGGFPGSKKKSTLKWKADGTGFDINSIISGEFNGNSFEVKIGQTWTLSADGKTLTVVNSISSPQGEFSSKAAYDKQ